MKAQFLKIAGVKSEAAFYKKFPSEEAFFKAHPKARNLVKKALGGSSTPPTANQFFDYGMQARGPLVAPDISYQTGGQYGGSINETDFDEPNYYNDVASDYEQMITSMYPSYNQEETVDERYKYGGAKKKYKTGGSNGVQGGNINAAGGSIKEDFESYIRSNVANNMMNEPMDQQSPEQEAMARYGGQRRLRRAQEGMAMQEQAPQQGGDPMAQIAEQVGQALQQGAKPEEVVVQLLQNQMPPETVAQIFVQLGMPQEQVQQLITTVMEQVQGAQQGAPQDQMMPPQDQMMAEEQMDPNQAEQMPMAAYGMELPQRRGNEFTDMYQNELDSNAQGSKDAWGNLANVFQENVNSKVQQGAADLKAKDQAAFWDQFKNKNKKPDTWQNIQTASYHTPLATSDVDMGQGQSIDLAPQNPNPWQMKQGGALKKFLPKHQTSPGQTTDPNSDPNGDSGIADPNSSTNENYTNEGYNKAKGNYPDTYTGPGSDNYQGGVKYEGSVKTNDANKTTTTTNNTELEKHIKYFADANGLDYDLLLKNYKDRMYGISNNQGQGYYGDSQQVPYKYKHRGYGTIGSDRGYIPTGVDLEKMSRQAEELGYDVKKAKIRNNMFGTKVVFKTKYNPNTGKIEKVAEKVSNDVSKKYFYPETFVGAEDTRQFNHPDTYVGSEINPINNSVVPITNASAVNPNVPLSQTNFEKPYVDLINQSRPVTPIVKDVTETRSNIAENQYDFNKGYNQGGALNRFLPKHQVNGNTGNWFDNLMHPNKNNKSERSVWKTKKEPNPFAADYMMAGMGVAESALNKMNDPRLRDQLAYSQEAGQQYDSVGKDMGDYVPDGQYYGGFRPNEMTPTFDTGYEPGNAAGDYGNYSKQGGPISPYPYPSQIPFMQGNGNSRNMSMYSGWSQRPVMAYGGGYQQDTNEMYLDEDEINQIMAMGGQIEYLD